MQRLIRIALYVLVAWQAGVLLLALVGQLFSGPAVPPSNGGMTAFVESLFHPDTDDVVRSRTLFERNREAHFQSFGQVVAPKPDIAVDEWGIPLSLGPPPVRALAAINRGMYEVDFIRIVLELPDTKGYGRDGVWKDLARNAAAIVLLVNERYDEGAMLFAGTHTVYENEFTTAKDSFDRLAVAPNDFAARLALVRALARMSHSAWLSQALCDQYWRLVEPEATNAELAQVLQHVQSACVSGYSAPPWTWRRENLVAACRLLAAEKVGNPDLASTIASLGDLEAEKGNPALAAAIFQAIADRYPDCVEWARCVYNAGVLYARLGASRQAIATLQRIFPSKADDLEPGSHLMEAYRNYRYNAALQVGNAYKRLWNYPMAYVWYYRGAHRYTYRSWCGTCRAEELRAQSRRLLLTSLEAGPAFLVANLALSPARNWMVVFALAVAGCILWRRRCRRTAAVSATPDPP